MYSAAFLAALLAPLVAAHGHHDVTKEMAERRAFLLQSSGNLNHCAPKIAERGLEKRAAYRRAGLASKLTKRSNLDGQHFKDLLNMSHYSGQNYTVETDPAEIFADGGSCLLNPEATEGPFYVAGEVVRQDVVDGEEGVPLAVDVQAVDVETCEPIQGAYFEIWHTNSTGVYSGIVTSMNGNGDDDPDNIDAIFGRGIQQLDDDGAAQFHTIFPGHYAGRATHIHIMLHKGATEQSNGTVMDLTAAHVGQMYFDQDLIAQVEKAEPYTENEMPVTRNRDDFILAGEANSTDPIMEYVWLGDGVEDGILAWLSIGVNTTYERNVTEAATLHEEGGQLNENPPFACFTGGGFGTAPTGSQVPTALPNLSGGYAIPSGGCEPSGTSTP